MYCVKLRIFQFVTSTGQVLNYTFTSTVSVYSWVPLSHFAVNLTYLSGVNFNFIDVYSVVESANGTKLHIFAKQTQGQHIQ